MQDKVVYHQQFTHCGKQGCGKCREGLGHGPYWYAYVSENGQSRRKYIGKQLPDSIQASQQQECEISYKVSSLPMLRVYTLGQFHLERNCKTRWQAVTDQKWQQRRLRSLFSCLLSSPGRKLAREQVMEALWPDLDIETAAQRLNSTIHHLRQVLEPDITRPSKSSLLRLEHDMFILANQSLLWLDTDAFEEMLNHARVNSDPLQTEQLLVEAAALYHGDFLPEEQYSEWTGARRETLRRNWISLLLQLVDLYMAKDAFTNAMNVLDRLLGANPTHEVVVQRLMNLLVRLGRREEALDAYHQLVTTLKQNYDIAPLSETSEIYNTVRQGNLPAFIEAMH